MTPSRAKKVRDAARQTQPDLTIVLENIYDPLNISAVMRSCDAVGIREIYVIYSEKYLDKRGLVLGKRTSAGTFKWIDVFVFDSLEECFKRVKARYGRVLATLPSESSHSLYDLDFTQPTALLFGNEDDGLSPESIALCDGFFTIPQAGFAESLNISVACAVSLYEAYRQRLTIGCYTDHPKLDLTQQEALVNRWSVMIRAAKYHNRGILISEMTPEIMPVYAKERIAPLPMVSPTLPLSNFDL